MGLTVHLEVLHEGNVMYVANDRIFKFKVRYCVYFSEDELNCIMSKIGFKHPVLMKTLKF